MLTIAASMKWIELLHEARRYDDAPFGVGRPQHEWTRIAEAKQRFGRWTLLTAVIIAATAAATAAWLDLL